MLKRRVIAPGLIALVLLMTLTTPLLRIAPGAPAAAQGQTVPLPVAGLGEHPRLLITQAYVDSVLKPRAEQTVPSWVAFATYVESGDPEEDAEWTPTTALRSLALAWLVTGLDGYGERSKAIMVELVNRVENHPAMTGQDGFDSAFMEGVAGLAVGYDWLYDLLTPGDRAALENTLWRAAKVLRNPSADTEQIVWLDGQLVAFGNYDPRWLWALTAVALVLYDKNEDSRALLDFCRQTFTETVIPALDVQSGGAWAEGPIYGFIAIWAKVQTALAWWTALGENHFDDTPWWYDRLAYDLFLYHPAATTTHHADWGDPMHSYPSIIGDAERYHSMFVYGRAQDLLLRAVFAGTEHGSWMDWFLRQPPDYLPGWMAVEEYLWRDYGSPGLPPSIRTWYAPFLGHVFLRSHWTTSDGALDPAAAYVSFNAGDHLAYHQFFDQGNFTFFYNGVDLVVRSGVYSGDGTSDHDANYYVRTIAGNTILVCDLDEIFDGIRPNNERDVWLNDCGQRAMYPASRTAINLDYLLENWQAYDTGSIVRFGEIGEVTYLRADITGAYNSTVYTTPDNNPKVSLVVREFVFWRPNILIVHDRVVTTYPSYTPQTVFHFRAASEPIGVFFRSQLDNAAVYLQNLRPGTLPTVVEGYQVAGQMVDQSWGEPASNDFEDEMYGIYRLEITPAAPDIDHWFLAALVAQNADAAPPSESVLVEGEGMRGVVRGSVQVMFDLKPGDGQDVTEARFAIGSGVEYTLLTGLRPNADYLVETEGVLAAQSFTANDAGMILLDRAAPGGVRLEIE